MEQNISYRKIMLCAALLLFAMAKPGIAVEPSLGDIMANVTKSMVPLKGYEVAVTQSMTSIDQAEAAISSTAPVETTLFYLNYHAVNGLSSKTEPSEGTLAPETTPTTAESVLAPSSTETAKPTVRIRFDVKKVFADLQLMDNIVIASDVLNDRSHWKVTGMNGDGSQGIGYVLWIDAEQWYVSRFTVKIANNVFSDANFVNRLSGSVWLPSKIIYDFPLDGSRVVQEFGTYVFEQ